MTVRGAPASPRGGEPPASRAAMPCGSGSGQAAYEAASAAATAAAAIAATT